MCGPLCLEAKPDLDLHPGLPVSDLAILKMSADLGRATQYHYPPR